MSIWLLLISANFQVVVVCSRISFVNGATPNSIGSFAILVTKQIATQSNSSPWIITRSGCGIVRVFCILHNHRARGLFKCEVKMLVFSCHVRPPFLEIDDFREGTSSKTSCKNVKNFPLLGRGEEELVQC